MFESCCSNLTSVGFINQGLGKIVEKWKTKQKTEANSVPSKTSKMELFTKIINGFIINSHKNAPS